jgi:hypothetical protein
MAAECEREAKRLVGLLDDAYSVQFDPPRAPRLPDDPGIRAKGGHSDPTANAALDPRRLTVRSELRTARRHLREAAALLRGSSAALERALDAWGGFDDPTP